MENKVKVGMADLNICKHPGSLTTLGLGSCVGVALYDDVLKIIGLAHIMLPNSKQAKNNSNIAKFADTAIDELIKKMLDIGVNQRRLTAKLAGGAQMFAFSNSNDVMRIGARNVEASKKRLQELKIPIIAEDTGGNYGRTIELYSEDGSLLVKTIGHGVSII